MMNRATFEMVSLLNKALEADSGAITALFSVRVACNPELQEKTGIKCKKQAYEKGSISYDVGVLEVLRAVLGTEGLDYRVGDDKKISKFTLDLSD